MSLVLHVGWDHSRPDRRDVGSTLCLSLLAKLPKGIVKVKDASLTPPSNRPEWLTGTPTLSDESGAVYRGYSAYATLLDIAFACSVPHSPPPPAPPPQSLAPTPVAALDI